MSIVSASLGSRQATGNFLDEELNEKKLDFFSGNGGGGGGGNPCFAQLYSSSNCALVALPALLLEVLPRPARPLRMAIS